MKDIAFGVAKGFTTFAVFVYLAPHLFRMATGLPIEMPSPAVYAALSALFIGMGIAERYAVYPLRLPIRLLNVLLGVAILVAILGSGRIAQTVPSEGTHTAVEVDFGVLLHVVVVGLVLLSFISFPRDEDMDVANA